MGSDYYKLLGVSKDADDNEIKKAYKKMVSGVPLVRPPSPTYLACRLSNGILTVTKAQKKLRRNLKRQVNASTITS